MEIAVGTSFSLDRLVSIMKRLRDPSTGCEWDSVQTFATIAPYTIEEAYEVADAIARNDMGALADELGDLQLQVVFHAQMAEEAGHFALDDVINGICDKMERRHPHIFDSDGKASLTPKEVKQQWEEIKAAERQAERKDADEPAKTLLSGVPRSTRASGCRRCATSCCRVITASS